VGRIGEGVQRLREALENEDLNATIRIRSLRPAR
jgi:hypothetical protein